MGLKGRRLGVCTSVLVLAGSLAGIAVARDGLGKAGTVKYGFAVNGQPGPIVAEARCKGGGHVAGGGFVSFADAGLTKLPTLDSAPYDGGDRDKRPDDGWRTRTATSSPSAKTVAYANCTRKVPGSYRKKIEQQSGLAPPLVKVSCGKDRHVLSGGARTSGADQAITATFPFDSGDPGNKPDDGWAVGVLTDGGQHQLKAYAVCAKKMPSYRTITNDLEPGTGTAISAECPGRKHVVGVGGMVEGPRHYIDMDRAVPNDFTDGDEVPDDRADVFLSNDLSAPSTQTEHAYAICIK